MNDKKNTSKIVDELLDAATTIEVVNTPPFFKDKVLNRLSQINEKKREPVALHWFAPKYQIAVLVLFAILNLGVLYSYTSSNDSSELQTFAQSTGLSTTESDSILN